MYLTPHLRRPQTVEAVELIDVSYFRLQHLYTRRSQPDYMLIGGAMVWITDRYYYSDPSTIIDNVAAGGGGLGYPVSVYTSGDHGVNGDPEREAAYSFLIGDLPTSQTYTSVKLILMDLQRTSVASPDPTSDFEMGRVEAVSGNFDSAPESLFTSIRSNNDYNWRNSVPGFQPVATPTSHKIEFGDLGGDYEIDVTSVLSGGNSGLTNEQTWYALLAGHGNEPGDGIKMSGAVLEFRI